MPSGQIIFHRYRPAAVLKVTGEDAFSFLQGQFTNELRQAPGSVTYGLWLNQKGKIVADSHVLRLGENEFRVVSFASQATAIRQRLEDYIVADDVVVSEETEAMHGLVVAGPGCGIRLARLFEVELLPGRFVESRGGLFFPGRRMSAESCEIVGPEDMIASSQDKLFADGCREADRGEMEFERIAAGIPAIPDDLGPADLPNEGGLEETALSFTKGCYLGQEVMARLKNLGQVRRRLHVVRGEGAPPEPRTALYQGGKKVGEVRSGARNGSEFVAFAMLSLINLAPGAGLSLAPDAPAAIRIVRHG